MPRATNESVITNHATGTRVDEIGRGLFRITTPLPTTGVPAGFSFNQFLLVDEKPLLFHTGPRKLFPLVREAISAIMPVERLSYIGFGHVEADECGSLNDFLAIAPNAVPVCGTVAATMSIDDLSNRPARALADGELLPVGRALLKWIDAPHFPHAWDSGYLFDLTSRTLLAGDLFAQPGSQHPPVTESDILESSEKLRSTMDYFSRSDRTSVFIEKLAALDPLLLACMHGAAYRGDGAELLRALGQRIESERWRRPSVSARAP
ncbi:MAG: MBL fold metallo-hydrolase [Deltaproteobacteria bacterium]|nr:MBL fold metallo-hydrolase [Deltaproteobacteria bacterium]